MLWMLSLYAFIRALRDRELFWYFSAIVTWAIVTVGLTLLNMKWPVLVYFMALLVAAFVFSKHYIMATVFGTVVFGAAYFLVTASVLRITPEKSFVIHAPPPFVEQASPKNQDSDALSKSKSVEPTSPSRPPESIQSGNLKSLMGSSLVFLINPISRMAVSYPYYYSIFTREGHICGGPISQILPNPPCVPTWLVYQRILPEDKQFAGRGTSPAGVHITAFALGGWWAAVLELAIAGLFLGVCAATPFFKSSVWGAIFTTGVIMGYHWSQVPLEGPIIYDYGVVWSFLMMAILILTTFARRRFLIKRPF